MKIGIVTQLYPPTPTMRDQMSNRTGVDQLEDMLLAATGWGASR